MRLAFPIAFVLALGAAPIGVAAAAPGSDTIVEANAITVPAASGGGSFVPCPAGSLVTGGGIGFAGFTPGSLPADIARTNPTTGSGGFAPPPQDGATPGRWHASITNLTQLILEPTAFALCSTNSDAVAESETFDVPAGKSGGAAAACPSGTRVLGGGVGQTTSTTSTIVGLSGPLDETGLTDNTADGDVARYWYAYVWNASNAAASYRVVALCSAGSDAIVEATEFNVDYLSSDAVAATCPAGRRAVGGGINTTGPALNGAALGYRAIMSHPVDETGGVFGTQDGDVARGWRSAIWNQSGSIRSFKTMALCVRDPAVDGGPGPGPGPGPAPGGDQHRCAGERATIVGTAGRDRLRGTPGADVIVALGGGDVVRAGRGNDLVCAGAGNDSVYGGSGADRVRAGSGNDRVLGGSGNDRLLGGSGHDRLSGESGRDRCLGGAGRGHVRCERKA